MTEVQQQKHFDGRRLGKLSALLAWVQILRLILSSTDFYIAAAIFFSVAAPYWRQQLPFFPLVFSSTDSTLTVGTPGTAWMGSDTNTSFR